MDTGRFPRCHTDFTESFFCSPISSLYRLQAGEVALLTRNIHITAAEEAPPSQLVGGQVMVYNTQATQVFFGVEFSRLGQQGNLGRSALHYPHVLQGLGISAPLLKCFSRKTISSLDISRPVPRVLSWMPCCWLGQRVVPAK